MPQQNMLTFVVFQVIPILLIFYFLIIRPQRQQQKKTKDMQDSLKKNDEIITSSGIHGTVVIVKDKTVVIRVDEGTRLEILREHISTIRQPQAANAEVVK